MVRAVVRVSVVIIDCRQSQSSLIPGRGICYRTSRIHYIPSIYPSRPYPSSTTTIMTFNTHPPSPPPTAPSIFYIFHPANFLSSDTQSQTPKRERSKKQQQQQQHNSPISSLAILEIPSFLRCLFSYHIPSSQSV